jgi:hypothetical protein
MSGCNIWKHYILPAFHGLEFTELDVMKVLYISYTNGGHPLVN